MFTWLIGVISGLCTIAIATFGIYAWVRNHALIIRVHDPMKTVQGGSISIVDVERAMQRMVQDAQDYQPSHIVGINRGGAIVGGWLSKQLGREAPIIMIVNSDEPPGKRVTPHLSRNDTLSGRVYLVDDAQRKGEHMREAAQYLMTKYPGVQVRRAVLLQMNVPHQGPESVAFRGTRSEFNGFMTRDVNVTLPWDGDSSPR
jgi:hypothetical protein